MNYQISLAGAMLQTGAPPMLQTIVAVKHRSKVIKFGQLTGLAPIHSLKRLPVADCNSSFD